VRRASLWGVELPGEAVALQLALFPVKRFFAQRVIDTA
jgi:hypothetical protein